MDFREAEAILKDVIKLLGKPARLSARNREHAADALKKLLEALRD